MKYILSYYLYLLLLGVYLPFRLAFLHVSDKDALFGAISQTLQPGIYAHDTEKDTWIYVCMNIFLCIYVLMHLYDNDSIIAGNTDDEDFCQCKRYH